MKEVDPGHVYQLLVLDAARATTQPLVFFKREGARYPGNVGSHPGTNLQSVLRACYARVEYLNRQNPCLENQGVLEALSLCIYLLEWRAAHQHGRLYPHDKYFARTAPMCPTCGHTACEHKVQP